MSFETLQKNLRDQGWLVEWNMPCCQSCAWSELPYEHKEGPFKGQEVDLSKVLFNHSQDCEVYLEEEECTVCHGEEGWQDDDGKWYDCNTCGGEGYIYESYDGDPADIDSSVDGFTCHTPESQDQSTFCFDGSAQGVKNLKAIVPIMVT